VVFSAGQNNRSLTYAQFAERIASHGFVVAVAHHQDTASVVPHDPAYYKHIYNRPRDVSFMLDALLAMNDDVGNLLYNSMRPDRVAAAGHSIGGYAALALAAGDDEICHFEDGYQPIPACDPTADHAPIADQQGHTIPTLPDPRIKAIVTLDAVNRSLRFGELGRITIPSIGIGESYGATGWDTFLGARQHAAIPAEFNYRVDIPGAVHQSFTHSCTGVWATYRAGLTTLAQVTSQLGQPWCSTALNQGEVNRLSAKYAIAFLKTHLAGETGYEHILTPGWALTRESNIEFFRTEPTDAVIPSGTFQYFAYQPGSYWFLKNRPGHTKDPVPNVITESTETTVTP
jgi:predicted dienelactone hydrolase